MVADLGSRGNNIQVIKFFLKLILGERERKLFENLQEEYGIKYAKKH